MKIKIAQCWDDGVATDIRLIEILRKYQAKATFNLCPGLFQEERIEPHWLEPVGRAWSISIRTTGCRVRLSGHFAATSTSFTSAT